MVEVEMQSTHITQVRMEMTVAAHFRRTAVVPVHIIYQQRLAQSSFYKTVGNCPHGGRNRCPLVMGRQVQHSTNLCPSFWRLQRKAKRLTVIDRPVISSCG